ncbi:MAG TPA: DUF302 domain-containing protein [Deltaproteobacteria bacterium]|nr:DUF302 domain-containing protein [Deltaproteobacteria bacterium]
MAEFSIKRKVNLSYEEAEKKIREALAEEGFGILTEIDVKATLKKKLDKDFRKYIILGACNPPYAYRALTIEPEIGVFMPCNVLVYENEDGTTTVSAMDPVAAMEVVANPELNELAREIKEKIERALNSI